MYSVNRKSEVFNLRFLFLKGVACRGAARCGGRRMPPSTILSLYLSWFHAGMARYISSETALRRCKRSLKS